MSVMVNQLDIIAHNQPIAHNVRITGTGNGAPRAAGTYMKQSNRGPDLTDQRNQGLVHYY